MSTTVKRKIERRTEFVMIRLKAAERLEVERMAEVTGLNASELFRRSFKFARAKIESQMKLPASEQVEASR